MSEIILTRPDDWHVHLRDGPALAQTTSDVARYFGRAIVMPNLTPPVTTVAEAGAYRNRILAAMTDLPRQFEPLMVLYLTDRTGVEDIKAAGNSDFVHAVKLYPAGATTNSDSGVTDIPRLDPVLQAMEQTGVPLLIHGEVTDGNIDIFDREKVFIDTVLEPLVQRYPNLRVVLEHITTADAVAFVESSGENIAATITAHHLLYDRNDMLAGGIRPHFFCLPILKRNRHREALLKAATGGSTKFFLGTDSAPHMQSAKETACGCAGCYTANTALELYAAAFEQVGAMDKLESFASFHGPDFYCLPRNTDKILLQRQAQEVPAKLPLGDTCVIPLVAGEILNWSVTEQSSHE